MTKIKQFWSFRGVFADKEAGNLQHGGKNYPRADWDGEAVQAEGDKHYVHRQKQRGHDPCDFFEHYPFFGAEPSRLVIYGAAEENLNCRRSRKTAKQKEALLHGDKPNQKKKRGEKQRGRNKAHAGGLQVKTAAEFSDEHKWDDHQHPLQQHTRNAAEEHHHEERKKAEQKAVGRVFIEFSVIFRNGSCTQEPFRDS